MQGAENAVALDEVGRAVALREVEHERAEEVHVAEAHLVQEAARVALSDVAQFLGDGAEGFFPGDLDPLRINVESLLGVGALHRRLHAVRVVGVLKDALALGAERTLGRGRSGIAHDLNGDAVLHAVHVGAGAAHAHTAVTVVPAIFHLGIEFDALGVSGGLYRIKRYAEHAEDGTQPAGLEQIAS